MAGPPQLQSGEREFDSLDKITWAVLETSGKISLIQKS
ncbi:MAG: DUF421 domain-containing protein [Actinobacteria bacterium]|nr:MAG: DUF421 domain-containing protein [Actinomycetota bacterium]